MSHELLVFGARRPLGQTGAPFSLKLGSVEGLEVHELIHGTDHGVGFEVQVVLSLSPPTMAAQTVAAVLASALDGIVFDTRQDKVSFDGRGGAAVEDLAETARLAYGEARRAWCAIELAHREQERARFAILAALDPLLEQENDWSAL
ncbi:MAG: hypothetical protein JNJ54_20615 [Myxococcaceae bacterium]|nr:hypothetical protein [Myxococcaceae bacterium]